MKTVKTIAKDALLIVATAMITLGASAQTTHKVPSKKDKARIEHRFEGRRGPVGPAFRPEFRPEFRAEMPGGPRGEFRQGDKGPKKGGPRPEMKKGKDCKGHKGPRADKK